MGAPQYSWFRSTQQSQQSAEKRTLLGEMNATGTSSFFSTKQSFASSQHSKKGGRKPKVRKILFGGNGRCQSEAEIGHNIHAAKNTPSKS